MYSSFVVVGGGPFVLESSILELSSVKRKMAGYVIYLRSFFAINLGPMYNLAVDRMFVCLLNRFKIKLSVFALILFQILLPFVIIF